MAEYIQVVCGICLLLLLLWAAGGLLQAMHQQMRQQRAATLSLKWQSTFRQLQDDADIVVSQLQLPRA
jgi:hypothetical protein